MGRQHELAQLCELLDPVIAGGGQIARIEGDAGAGKSHLAAHFSRQAAERGLAIVVSACQSTDRTTAYFAGGQMVRAVLGLSGFEARPPAEQVAQVEATLRSWNPAWLPRLPLLGDLLGLSIADDRTTATLDARQRQEALISLAVDIVLHAARQRPFLFVVEDAHWLDEASRQLVLALGRVIGKEPVFCCSSSRPSVDDQNPFASALADLAQQTIVRLAELDALGTATLVRERLKGRLDELALAFIHRQAQGNPFFTEELVDALREDGHLVPIDDSWRLSPGLIEALRMANCLVRDGEEWRLAPSAPLSSINLGVPGSVHGLVLSRVDRLPEAAKLTLKVASVIGRVFEVDLLAAAHPAALDPGALLEQFGLFQSRDFARLETPQPRLTYIFKHNITQEVVYRTLLETQRHELHLAVAQALETQQPEAMERLAHHYQHGDLAKPQVRDRALHYLDAAAHRSQHDYANETALAYFDRALDLELRWEWLKGKTEVLHILGRREQEAAALEALDRAVGADVGNRMAAGLRWIDYFEAVGDYAAAQIWIARVQALARQLADRAGEAACLNRAGIVAWRQGDSTAAEEAYRAALLLAKADGLPNAESEARYGLGLVFRQQGRLDEARRQFEQDLTLNRQLGNRQNEARR